MTSAKPNALTPKQEQQLIDLREEYRQIGTSCTPADWEEAEKHITWMYAKLSKKRPKFFRCQSPLQALMEIGIVGDNLRANLWDNLRANLRANLWTNLGANLGINLRANLGANLRDNLRDNLGANNYVTTDLWGQLDSYWIAYYVFPNRYIKKMYSKQNWDTLMAWDGISKSCGWWWAFENAVFISDRFESLHQDGLNRLHNPDGPAMRFRDGYSIYAVNGVVVPEWVIETPEKITPQLIEGEKNAEVRRVMIGKYGWHNFLHNVDAKLIDRDPDPTIGELWRWWEPDGVEVKIIRALNGTPDPETGEEKWYSLRVPINFTLALHANRYTYPVARHLSDDEYRIWNQSRA